MRRVCTDGGDRVWVADLTAVRTWAGLVYVALILDVFSQRVVAWHTATNQTTDLVLTPLRMALWERDRHGHPIGPGQLVHHTDACLVPGLMEALIPREDESHGGTEEVPGRAA